MNSKSFEKKIEKSKEILEKLMDPEITLSKSIELYKMGLKELKEAETLLERAKLELQEYQKEENK